MIEELSDSELMTLLRDSIEMQDGKLYKRIQKEMNRRTRDEWWS